MSEAKYGIEPKGWYNEEDLRAVRNYGLWEGMGYASAAWVVVIASFLYVIGVFG